MDKNCKIVIAFLLGIIAYYFLFKKDLVEGVCIGPNDQNCGQYNDTQCADSEAINKGCSIQGLDMTVDGDNTTVCSTFPTRLIPGIIGGIEGGSGFAFGSSGSGGFGGFGIGTGSGTGSGTAAAATASATAQNMVIPSSPTTTTLQGAIAPALEQANTANLDEEQYRVVTYTILKTLLRQVESTPDLLRSGLQYIIDNAHVSGNIAQAFLDAINKGVTPAQLIQYIDILGGTPNTPGRTQEIITQAQNSFRLFLDGNPGPITPQQFDSFIQTIPENSEGATQPSTESNSNSNCTDEIFNAARSLITEDENDKTNALLLYPVCEERINSIPLVGCLDDGIRPLTIQTCAQSYGGVNKTCPSGQTPTNLEEECSQEICCTPDGTPDENIYPAGTKIMFCYNHSEWTKLESFLREKTEREGGHKVFFTTTQRITYDKNSQAFIDDPDSVIKNSFITEIERIYISIKDDEYFNNNESIREYIDNNPDFFDVTRMELFNSENVTSVHICRDDTDATDKYRDQCTWYTDVPEDGLVYTPC